MIVSELVLVLKLISVHQLYSVVLVLICKITVITVKTFEKTRLYGLKHSLLVETFHKFMDSY